MSAEALASWTYLGRAGAIAPPESTGAAAPGWLLGDPGRLVGARIKSILDSPPATGAAPAIIELPSLSPTIIPPVWLARVEHRISRAIESPYDNIEDEVTITKEIGELAVRFLEAAADQLPSEPHLSRSNKGELVLAHGPRYGNLTTLIGDGYLIVFAATAGDEFLKRLENEDDARTFLIAINSTLNYKNGKKALAAPRKRRYQFW